MQEQFAVPDWRPGDDLMPREEEMRDKAAAGGLVDRGAAKFDLAGMKAWAGTRTVRAAVLRHLLVEDEWPVGTKGVRLRGVRIKGHLDLEAATIRCPLSLQGCYFDSLQPAALSFAKVSLLELKSCHLAGLVGKSLVVSKDLDLSESTLTCPIDLSAADITSDLRLRGARLHGRDDDGNALVADSVKIGGRAFLNDGFIADGCVRMPGADITGRLRFRRATLNGKDNHGSALLADGIKARGGVGLDETCTTKGALRLVGAEIASDLRLSQACLHGKDDDGNALVADSVKIGGRATLDDGFIADGCVRMPGADITGRLRFRRATLNGKDNHGSALLADGIKARGGMELDETCTTRGALRLVGADIAGDLKMSGVSLNGKDGEGNALVANGIRVSGDVIFGKNSRSSAVGGSTADGALSLRSAHVGGSLHLRPEKLAGEKDDEGKWKVAVDMEGARIARDLVWEPGQQISGQVILEDTEIGQLKDSLPDSGGHWPSVHPDLMLRLRGFTYRGFGGDNPGTVDDRLRWIGSLGKAKRAEESTGTRYFASQPYEQLAAVYRQAGEDTEARKVAIARRADLRKYGDLELHRRIGNWLLDKTIKYGYQTWRAGLALAVVFVAFWTLAYFAQRHHLMEPVGSFHGPAPSATQCIASYPCFYPLGYTINTVIPIINVHQATYWGPNASTPWGWAWAAGTAIATGLGWALATLLVAGYTGLVRQE